MKPLSTAKDSLLLRTTKDTRGRHRPGRQLFVFVFVFRFAFLLDLTVPILQLKDDQKRVIAVFERGSHGLIRETRPASLQIADAAIPITDEIFATFICMQQKVRQRSNAAGASGGGVGDGGGGGGC